MVLLHGVSMSWRVWRPVLPALTARHDVIAPTLAGHRGGPDFPADASPGIGAIADVLCDQLDRAGIEVPHLVGNSLGGWVALELARRGRARSVTAISPAGSWKARRDLAQLLLMFKLTHRALGNPALAAMSRNPILRKAALRRLMVRPGRVPAEEMDELVRDFEECPLFAALADGRARLHRIEQLDIAHCPVHIAWAERDRLIPYGRFGESMRPLIPGARFSMLPGVGHVPMYDDPTLIARTILELTTQVDEFDEPGAAS
ncbi:MAG TPA: alpha/beta fold hydrolase [Pseudonocardia sp.]|nr:alpha/beta fold hydrolase [Pseudonocardia sp.]